jgi:hypothetical protein
MLSSMETIYDVLRLLVSKARGTITDREIELAQTLIDRHEKAAHVRLLAGDDAEADHAEANG